MTRHNARVALACLAIATFALLACRSSASGDKTATRSAHTVATYASVVTATATTTPSAATSHTLLPVSPTPNDLIRNVDLADAPDVKAALTAAGGQFTQARVIYAELTGTGELDAVVPIASGGTLGDVAFLVLAPGEGGVTKTLLRGEPTGQFGLAVAVEGGKLVMTEPVYGPEDPECCPTQLKNTTYAWNGAEFIVASTTTQPNPAGGAKGTH